MDGLFNSIGKKIKGLATAMFVIEAIGAVITGIVFLISWGFEEAWWSLFIIIFGPVVAWVSSWFLYAFGQIVDDVRDIRDQNYLLSSIHADTQSIVTSLHPGHKDNPARDQNETVKQEAARNDTEHQESESVRYAAKMGVKKQEPTPAAQENTLRDHLEYALKFQTDVGMIGYLKKIQDETVQSILQSPESSIREQIKDLLSKM